MIKLQSDTSSCKNRPQKGAAYVYHFFYPTKNTVLLQFVTTKGVYNIPIYDIFFIECRQKKVFIHTRTDTLSLPLPLYRIEEALPTSFFLQTHRSFLVNLKNISHIDKQTDPWTIHFFETEETAFISRSFRRQVMAAVSD